MITIISSSAKPRPRSNVSAHSSSDGGMTLTVTGGAPIALNPTARRIFELCDGARNVAYISDRIADDLHCPRNAVLSEVRTGVASLVDMHALQIDYAPKPRLGPADVDWARLAAPQPDHFDTEAVLDFIADKLHSRWFYCGDNGEDWWQPSGVLALGEGRVDTGYCYSGPYAALLPKAEVDAPLDHPNIAQAEQYLQAWPEGAEQFGRLMRYLHPTIDPKRPCDERAFLQGSSSHSEDHRAMFGTLFSTINCPLMLADNCVHEMAHQKLFALGLYKESATALITNDPSEMYASPVIVNRPRPMMAVLHGVYAFCYVVQLELKVLSVNMLEGECRQMLEGRLSRNLGRLQAGFTEIVDHVRSDACGTAFLGGMYRWIDQMFRDSEALLGYKAFPLPPKAPQATARA